MLGRFYVPAASGEKKQFTVYNRSMPQLSIARCNHGCAKESNTVQQHFASEIVALEGFPVRFTWHI
jgi:hypothetical protein